MIDNYLYPFYLLEPSDVQARNVAFFYAVFLPDAVHDFSRSGEGLYCVLYHCQFPGKLWEIPTEVIVFVIGRTYYLIRELYHFLLVVQKIIERPEPGFPLPTQDAVEMIDYLRAGMSAVLDPTQLTRPIHEMLDYAVEASPAVFFFEGDQIVILGDESVRIDKLRRVFLSEFGAYQDMNFVPHVRQGVPALFDDLAYPAAIPFAYGEFKSEQQYLFHYGSLLSSRWLKRKKRLVRHQSADRCLCRSDTIISDISLGLCLWIRRRRIKAAVLTLTSSKLFRSGIHYIAIAVRAFLLYTLTDTYATDNLEPEAGRVTFALSRMSPPLPPGFIQPLVYGLPELGKGTRRRLSPCCLNKAHAKNFSIRTNISM